MPTHNFISNVLYPSIYWYSIFYNIPLTISSTLRRITLAREMYAHDFITKMTNCIISVCLVCVYIYRYVPKPYSWHCDSEEVSFSTLQQLLNTHTYRDPAEDLPSRRAHRWNYRGTKRNTRNILCLSIEKIIFHRSSSRIVWVATDV